MTVSEVTGQINSNHPSPPQAGFVRPIDHSLGFEVCAGDATGNVLALRTATLLRTGACRQRGC